MVKICQTGLLTLNFEIIPKKRIFRFLPKISAGHAWSWKIFFANFQILGPLGCQGWVVIPQNVKKIQNHCTLISISAVLLDAPWLSSIVRVTYFLQRWSQFSKQCRRRLSRFPTSLCAAHCKTPKRILAYLEGWYSKNNSNIS